MAEKILVVDDSSFMHSMYDMVLGVAGDRVVLHAESGIEALEILARTPDCDLIVLDINMPEMNGLEFLERYMGSGFPRLAPVVISSTEGTEDDTQRGLDAGAVAYLKKPFQPSDLQEVVRSILEGVGKQEALT